MPKARGRACFMRDHVHLEAHPPACELGLRCARRAPASMSPRWSCATTSAARSAPRTASHVEAAPPEDQRDACHHARYGFQRLTNRSFSHKIYSSAAVSTMALGRRIISCRPCLRAPWDRPNLPAPPGNRSAPGPSCSRALRTAAPLRRDASPEGAECRRPRRSW